MYILTAAIFDIFILRFPANQTFLRDMYIYNIHMQITYTQMDQFFFFNAQKCKVWVQLGAFSQ